MKSIRRHLNYANIVATLALVFAMGGSAIAAKHYLITSTNQISPKVLKKLKAPGKTGKTGPQGPTGSLGAAGSLGGTGLQGAKGNGGGTGADGISATSPLPSGESESGYYGLAPTGGKIGAFMATEVSFPIPLEEGAPAGQVIYTSVKTPVTHCSGPGHADKGFVCIYSWAKSGLSNPPIIDSLEEPETATPGTGRFGFNIEWAVTALDPVELGTWTVTAG
jgi:hypothetical protein